MHKLIIGCGYLGGRVADAWLAQGHRVTALTRSGERAEAFRQRGIEPVVGDVLDRGSLAGLPAADTVLYAVGFDRRSGRSLRDVYVDGLRNVLDEIAPRTGRFLYISSTSVYGQSAGEWVDESSPCEPTRPNGQACLDAERLVRRAFGESDDISPPSHLQNISPPSQGGAGRGETESSGPAAPPQPPLIKGGSSEHGATVLRLAGLYGPGRLLRRVDEVRSGEPIAGNPESWLNLIHVDDAVRAVLACEEPAADGSTWLVCDDRPVRRREYYELLARLLAASPPRFAEPSEPGDLNKRLSNRRLREELGVELQYPTIAAGLPHALSEKGDWLADVAS